MLTLEMIMMVMTMTIRSCMVPGRRTGGGSLGMTFVGLGLGLGLALGTIVSQVFVGRQEIEMGWMRTYTYRRVLVLGMQRTIVGQSPDMHLEVRRYCFMLV